MSQPVAPPRFDDEPLFVGSSVFKHPSAALLSIPKHKHLTEGDHFYLQSEGNYYLIFLLQGKISTSTNGKQEAMSFEAKQMIFVPMGTLLHVVAEEDTSCIIFHFLPSVHLCARQCPERPKLSKDMHIPNFKKGAHLTSLPLAHGIDLWTHSIVEYLQYSLSDLRLFDVKLQELFLLLRMNYARCIQEEFLRSFHCKRSGFSCQVFRHFPSCRTVEDLANKLGVPVATLTRMFDEEFGISPLQWILQQRARHVYKDLVDSTLSLTEISERYYFSSPGYLSAFCRRMFGVSPLKIRRGQHTLSTSDSEDFEE